MGLGTGCLFTPVNAMIGLHFKKRRGLAYGVVLTGVSLGSMTFPISKLNRPGLASYTLTTFSSS
jgi:MFS family permease